MPTNDRRSRNAAGSPASRLRAALQVEIKSLRKSDDPAQVVKDIVDLFAQMDASEEVLAEVRLEAVLKLRAEGWSYGQISKATGLSEPRVAQLARAGGAGGRVERPKK